MNSKHEKRLAEYRKVIEKELLQALLPIEFSVGEAMRYSTLGGGKRLRGVLTLEFCKAFGGDVAKAVPVAAAVEMIQSFSLIHDDLPCMDNDDFRRGKPSCHKQYGEATAFLAGDALLANAFNTACFTAFSPAGIKPANAMSVVSALSNATMEMIKGQQLDMDFEGYSEDSDKKIDEDDIINMYNRKTCALISAACVCGAICADAPDSDIHLARSYGVSLGLAFQIADDLLDLESEKAGKTTYATVFGVKKSRKKLKEYSDMAVKIAARLPKSEFLRDLVEYMTNN
ncbi:MAG: polyprenyl synthetase family protein [Oscillospiraceae bacterium]|nr:polyprenyl synthetase family protein [Oscillospiraceae bacterium]